MVDAVPSECCSVTLSQVFGMSVGPFLILSLDQSGSQAQVVQEKVTQYDYPKVILREEKKCNCHGNV